jgi:antitoxin component of MazEF toxin-antitoxin module
MATEVMIRRWGSSLGVILPKDLVEKDGLAPDSKIYIEIIKVADISSSFGALKSKMSGQEFKDMVRKGWN